MDVHSYTSKAEVMGLLGGEFLPDQNLILIKKYIPCDSLENSGTHCDMCPGMFCSSQIFILTFKTHFTCYLHFQYHRVGLRI